jgi:hypothetical protein
LPVTLGATGASNTEGSSEEQRVFVSQVEKLAFVQSPANACGKASESDDDRSMLQRRAAKLSTPCNAAGSSQGFDNVLVTEDNDVQKSVSEITALMNGHINQRYLRQQRMSSSFQYTSGKVASALALFDPLHGTGNKPVRGKKLAATGDHHQLNAANVDQASVGENGPMDPSSKANNHYVAHKNGFKADAVSSSDDSSSGDFVHGIVPVVHNVLERGKRRRQVQHSDGGKERDTEAVEGSARRPSLPGGSSDSLNDSVHLLDQQNVNINTKRLSSVSTVDYFDILSGDGSAMVKSPTDKLSSIYSGSSFGSEGEGVTSSLPPRISLKLNSVELDLASGAVAVAEPSKSHLWTEEESVAKTSEESSNNVTAGSLPVHHTDSPHSAPIGRDANTWCVHSDSSIGQSVLGHENLAERAAKTVSAPAGRPHSHRKVFTLLLMPSYLLDAILTDVCLKSFLFCGIFAHNVL